MRHRPNASLDYVNASQSTVRVAIAVHAGRRPPAYPPAGEMVVRGRRNSEPRRDLTCC